MFYMLGVAICLAVLFLLIAGTLLFLVPACRLVSKSANSASPDRVARWFFTVRMAPLLVSCVVTFGFVLPAFFKFEPRSTGETMGLRLSGLAACGLVVVIAMAVRSVCIALATARTQAQWRRSSRKLYIEGFRFPLYCVDSPNALLAVTGIFRPKIFVTRKVVEALSPGELSAALAHEWAHVRAFDNLKQTLLKITRPPLWLADIAWTNASEIAADEAALATGASVLDLSSALVKVGRLGCQSGVAPGVAASHLLPASPGSAVEMRVKHLETILDGKGGVPVLHQGGRRTYRFLVPGLLGIAVYAACFYLVLPWVHEAMELLVR
jgi:hypothetical protein